MFFEEDWSRWDTLTQRFIRSLGYAWLFGNASKQGDELNWSSLVVEELGLGGDDCNKETCCPGERDGVILDGKPLDQANRDGSDYR